MADAGFDLNALQAAVSQLGRVARLVVAAHDGSSPREVGAAMLVWADITEAGGQSGTIGGGALEWEAVGRARAMLTEGATRRLDREALGPKLGQCCGGAVSVLTEVFEAADVAPLMGEQVIARPILTGTEMPLAVRRVLDRARAQGVRPVPQMIQGWMIEPVAVPQRVVWVWGAGHVGRALVGVLAPLPGLAITWVDVARARFPDVIPDGVTPLWAEDPALLMRHAPQGAEHLILTYSHALDLALCHGALLGEVTQIGLIGSATKWARFRSRLRALGHGEAAIGRITCPIGDPGLGKHPQAIAVGVAAAFLNTKAADQTARESAI